MTLLERIRQRAGTNLQRIVLPEGHDSRVLNAAAICTRERRAQIMIVGEEQQIRATAREADVDLRGIEIIDPRKEPEFRKTIISLFYDLRRDKGITRSKARAILKDPLYYANLMVRTGRADGCVAGAMSTTPHTIRAALHCIGVRRGLKLVSSFFLVVFGDNCFVPNREVIFADCSVVVEPTAADLAQISIASADSCRALLDAEPRVAMLVVAGDDPSLAAKMTEATRLAQRRAPKLKIAAIPIAVAIDGTIEKTQSLQSLVAGKANVFVFPDLQAANIALKLAEYIAGATAVGAVLQGLAKPANDLSRGCKIGDVADLIAITAVQAGQARLRKKSAVQTRVNQG
jgi:phosphate acetyltransferase